MLPRMLHLHPIRLITSPARVRYDIARGNPRFLLDQYELFETIKRIYLDIQYLDVD